MYFSPAIKLSSFNCCSQIGTTGRRRAAIDDKHSQPIFDLAFQVDNLSNIPKIVATNTRAL